MGTPRTLALTSLCLLLASLVARPGYATRPPPASEADVGKCTKFKGTLGSEAAEHCDKESCKKLCVPPGWLETASCNKDDPVKSARKVYSTRARDCRVHTCACECKLGCVVETDAWIPSPDQGHHGSRSDRPRRARWDESLPVTQYEAGLSINEDYIATLLPSFISIRKPSIQNCHMAYFPRREPLYVIPYTDSYVVMHGPEDSLFSLTLPTMTNSVYQEYAICQVLADVSSNYSRVFLETELGAWTYFIDDAPLVEGSTEAGGAVLRRLSVVINIHALFNTQLTYELAQVAHDDEADGISMSVTQVMRRDIADEGQPDQNAFDKRQTAELLLKFQSRLTLLQLEYGGFQIPLTMRSLKVIPTEVPAATASDADMSAGAIAAIVLGSIGGLALFIAAAWIAVIAGRQAILRHRVNALNPPREVRHHPSQNL